MYKLGPGIEVTILSILYWTYFLVQKRKEGMDTLIHNCYLKEVQLKTLALYLAKRCVRICSFINVVINGKILIR